MRASRDRLLSLAAGTPLPQAFPSGVGLDSQLHLLVIEGGRWGKVYDVVYYLSGLKRKIVNREG